MPCVAILSKQKCHFYFFFVSCEKLNNQNAEQVLPMRLVQVGEGTRWGKGEYGANTIQCVHMYVKVKNYTC
jgi:hypothetical protein